MNPDTRIFVAGHRGMVGSAIVRALQTKGYHNLLTRSHAELDLTDQSAVRAFFQGEKIDQVYLAAARVGGIHANNTYPAEFIYQNLMIQTNVIHEAWKGGVKKLLFLGSSCIYPRDSPQPIKEEYLLTGPLEPTNEPYAIAKIAGIKMCEDYNRQYGTDYRCVMPCNLYGPGDNYHQINSHVIPALIRRFHEAKIAGIKNVKIWGTGTPLRQFLYVNDLASACLDLMKIERNFFFPRSSSAISHINIGTGEEVSIDRLAHLIRTCVGYMGNFEFDPSMPNGTPQKMLDSSRLKALSFNWCPIDLQTGLTLAYNDFLNNQKFQKEPVTYDQHTSK
ncbi:GDP-L-fucose synthase family protein [Azonexus sp. IMCC34842]|uniref:GDP-L-fucose synthase family protein n=1 Tax=Azonexus sp. IMCC34842 TaxID=3420950 RepID=UPI003D0CF4BE